MSFVELWVCPQGDSAYAVQAEALRDEEMADALRTRARRAEEEHFLKFPLHFPRLRAAGSGPPQPSK